MLTAGHALYLPVGVTYPRSECCLHPATGTQTNTGWSLSPPLRFRTGEVSDRRSSDSGRMPDNREDVLCYGGTCPSLLRLALVEVAVEAVDVHVERRHVGRGRLGRAGVGVGA